MANSSIEAVLVAAVLVGTLWLVIYIVREWKQ